MTANEHQPVDVPLGLEDERWTRPDRLRQATWAFVGLGVLLRVVIYALNCPLWGDEAFVAANFITRGYRDLLRPLDYGQVCPLFFLWVELAAARLLGFHEWSLRLVPTLCGVGSVFLFAHVAGRVLRGEARVLAVAIFAVAYYPIRHSAEVKPYTTDLFAALVLLAMAIEWWRSPEKTRWLWALAIATPLALGFSHPAVFMAGGLSLGLAGMVWRERRPGVLVPFAVFNLAMVATFLVLFAVFTRAQAESVGTAYRSHYWAEAFPPLRQPVKLLLWLVEVHTGNMFAHPFGGANGASTLTAICFLAALRFLRRRGETALIAVALGPFGLAFVAAVLGRYPYGGSARTMLFLAPTICLMAGLGAAAIIARLHSPSSRRGVLRASVLGLAGSGLILLGFDLVHPYKSVHDERSRAFARRFWTEQARDAELVCVKRDLGVVFNPRHWQHQRSALYLSNAEIYSPRLHRNAPPDWNAVSASRPLRCVLYNEQPANNPTFTGWLESMKTRYRLARTETFVVNDSVRENDANFEDRYVVYEFVPRTDGVAAAKQNANESTRR